MFATMDAIEVVGFRGVCQGEGEDYGEKEGNKVFRVQHWILRVLGMTGKEKISKHEGKAQRRWKEERGPASVGTGQVTRVQVL